METKVEKNKNRCPKCSGLVMTTIRLGAPANLCTMCGLYYELGSPKESLRKQIQGEDFKPNRKELKNHDL